MKLLIAVARFALSIALALSFFISADEGRLIVMCVALILLALTLLFDIEQQP